MFRFKTLKKNLCCDFIEKSVFKLFIQFVLTWIPSTVSLNCPCICLDRIKKRDSNKEKLQQMRFIEIKATFEHNKQIEFGVFGDAIVIDRWNKRCIAWPFAVSTETCSSMTVTHRFVFISWCCVFDLEWCVVMCCH